MMMTTRSKTEEADRICLQLFRHEIRLPLPGTEYLALANEGCGSFVVHAAEEDRTKQAVAIVQPYKLKFAEKYNRLTLEELA